MRIRDEQKESAIREKAMEMIVKEGFDGLSMQKLAKAAGVSPATIYIYFKNREDLLNQLFNDVQQKFSEVALKDFSPELSFEEGLWVQWQNRLEFIFNYPVHFRFHEQFRNSPLIDHKDVDLSEFRRNMRDFVCNVMRRGEMRPLEPEVFWSVAYGTLYTLVQFHLHEKSFMNDSFAITDDVLKQTFSMVIKALKA